MEKPRKLIRSKIIDLLQPGEWEEVTDQQELNKLYELKVREELAEVVRSGCKDLDEFADLVYTSMCFARTNGYTLAQLNKAISDKLINKGALTNIALNNLNPNNPSNSLYYE